MHDRAGERVRRPEALDQEGGEGRDVDEEECRNRCRDLPEHDEPRAAPGEARDGTEGSRSGGALRADCRVDRHSDLARTGVRLQSDTSRRHLPTALLGKVSDAKSDTGETLNP